MTIQGHINSGLENNILSLQAGKVPQGEFFYVFNQYHTQNWLVPKPFP